MTKQEAERIALAGGGKARLSQQSPLRYFTRAMLAGCFIFLGTICSCIASAWFYAEQPAVAKMLGAATFSVALILIVLLGGELFTGCNFVMGFSLYDGHVRIRDTIRVWLLCYLGNFIGIFILCLLMAGSGACREMLSAYLALVMPAKLSAPWFQLLLRGVLCNLCVCIGVYGGFKLHSESGKVAAILCVIITFVLAGFEHSIANMAYFSLYALLVPGVSMAGIFYNLFWVTVGNILGGAVLLALPLWFLADKK